MIDFENWNRYYDPTIGRYLQPEPLAAVQPTMAAEPAYAYAGNNPINASDPSGLYRLTGDCPNWSAALQIAKTKAGCGGGTPANNCECKTDCDICMFLDDGSWPIASIMAFPSGTPAIPANSAVWQSNRPAIPAGGMPDHFVAFRKSLCEGPGNVMELAKAMVHEAIHLCKYVGGPSGNSFWEMTKSIFSGDEAKNKTDECFK